MSLERLRASLADRYRIEEELGQGGMATVYLAHDLRHDRPVAVKVLRPELAAVIGAERFLTEIRTTANLQHPHILPLFDSGEADGFLFYVMPYVKGETVRDRIAREQQLPVAEAVRIATEVASALDYAHRQNVIHRDIKPENILLHDGSALVADFGIALAASKAGGTRMTETGMSLGTPHYMSPEQAMGEREVTARSDVYALGCVLYEMLIGEPPFTGPTAQAIVARVVTEDPRPLTGQRKTIPPGVEAAVLTALEKLPADRFATAAEFAAALANPTTTTARTALHPAPAARRRTWVVTVALALLGLIAGLVIGGRRDDPGSITRADVVQATLTLGDSAVIRAITSTRFALDPAGRRVAFVGPDGKGTQLWVRQLDQPTARPLPDTKGAFCPFFSPGGESIGFFTSVGGETVLKVVPVDGGVARVVVQDSVAAFGGGSWGDDGQIYFTESTRGLARVSSSGGAVTRVSLPDTGAGQIREHDFPDVLPGSRLAVVMLWRGSIGSKHIGIVDLTTGAVTDLIEGSYARYVAPGFLAIGTADGRLLVARFDPGKGKLTSTPVPVLQGVQRETSNGTVQFAASATGTLIYQQESGSRDGRRTAWVRRADGSDSVQRAIPGDTRLDEIAYDPRGRYLLMRTEGSGVGSRHLLIMETGRDTLPRVLVQSRFDHYAMTLSPDGNWLAYVSGESGTPEVYVRPFPSVDSARFAISAGGGTEPLWRRDGAELFFRTPRGDMFAVPVITGRRFEHGVPTLLFSNPSLTQDEYHRAYDITPDGKRFLMVTSGGGDSDDLRVIFNWRTELERLRDGPK